jgi:GNAT superfamily N-acetyltransferase
VIRPRTPEDLPACVEALAKVHAADRYPVTWPADPGRFLAPASLTAAWVALRQEQVVGHVGLSLEDVSALDPSVRRALDTAERVAMVTRLFVTPEGRGRSYASRLLDVVREAAGLPLILDVSDEGRAAIALYERTGWQRVASVRADWLNAAGEPALLHYYTAPVTAQARADSSITPPGSIAFNRSRS